MHGFDNLVPFSLHKAFTDDPASVRFARVATNSYFRGGAPGVLGVLAVFTGSILLILWSTTSISDVCTAGTACTRGSVLLCSHYSQVLGPSALVLIFSVLGLRNVLDTPSIVGYTRDWRHL